MKTVLVTALLSAACIAVAAAPAAPLAAEQPAAAAAQLAIRFEGIEAPTGQIMLSVYDNAAAHDGNGRPVRVAMVPVAGSAATARFEGLAPGDYAVKAFHDVDGDGKMGTNPFGMPIEPYAFSNNARPEGAPPRWEAARFAVAAGENTVSITIK
ncbi:MAG: DUF2141 domain-containing protein [Erythrobacter sp.]